MVSGNNGILYKEEIVALSSFIFVREGMYSLVR